MRSIKSQGGLREGRGMTGSARHMWVLSLRYSASIHNTMMQISGAQIESSGQHAEMGVTRRQYDYLDCGIFLAWLRTRNPFANEDENLHSLSNGIVSIIGTDEVNCEKAEEIGLDNLQITFKRKEQIKVLESLKHSIKDKRVTAGIDSTIIFKRMIAVAERHENLQPFFEYVQRRHDEKA